MLILPQGWWRRKEVSYLDSASLAVAVLALEDWSELMMGMTEGAAVPESRLRPVLERSLGPSLDSAPSLTFDFEETILLAWSSIKGFNSY